jgi:hypothetical protein
MSESEAWLAQLPMMAALIFSTQDEPDADEAVKDALEILDACEDYTGEKPKRQKRERR